MSWHVRQQLQQSFEEMLKRFDKRVELRVTEASYELCKVRYLYSAGEIWCRREYKFDPVHDDWFEFGRKVLEDMDWIRRGFNTVLGMKDAGISLTSSN